MKLTYILISLLFLFNPGIAQPKAGFFQISGYLKNFTNAAFLIDDSEMSDLKTLDRLSRLNADSTGYFSATFPLSHANYFQLEFNQLYLQPGDSLVVKIDYNNAKNSEFYGKGSIANNYLKNAPYPKAASYLDGGLGIKLTVEETLRGILSSAQERTKELNATRGLTQEFRTYERARITADILNSFIYFRGLFKVFNKVPKDSTSKVNERIDRLLEPYYIKYGSDSLNASCLKIEAYRKISYILLRRYKGNNAIEVNKIKDWQNASELFDEMISTADRNKLDSFYQKIPKIADKQYRDELLASLQKSLLLTQGDQAVDFIAQDRNGKNVSLSDFKGKVIMIDVWATWCQPCMEELPYFNKLREKFKSNPDIVFISLSVDDDKAKWIKKLNMLEADGVQLHTNYNWNGLEKYKIVAIPRTIFISKDFKILEMFGMAPSDKKMESFILGIL